MVEMIKVLVLVLAQCVFIRSELVIGGLFYEGDESEAALHASAGLFNFATSVRKVSRRGELIEAGEHVCDLANEGVIGIIDATSGKVSAHVQAICDMLDLPHILVGHNDLVQENWFHLNLHPSPDAYNQVLTTLVTMKEWTNVTVMYEKGYSLMRVTDVLHMANKTLAVSIRELSGKDYRDVLINAKKNGYTNFIVDCPSKKLEQFLKHAQQVGLMADEHSYIFLSLDLFNTDLVSYRYGGVNMTGFKILTPTDWTTEQDFNKIKQYLIHDAVKVFSEAVNKMINMTEPSEGAVNCENYQSWYYGSSLLSFMKTNKIEGLTGLLEFDAFGQRSDVRMEIMELTPAGERTMGEWKNNEITITRPFVMVPDIAEESIMRNKTFKVLVAMVSPFCYLKESATTLEGNSRYEGFAIDLFEKLSEILGFIYEIEVSTLKYGGWNETTNKTDGMAGEIDHERADFAICDFTITSSRLLAIDFLTPFMSLGIAILYKEPSKQPPAMFSFMEVFAPEVWYYMVLIQLALGVVMILVGRLSHKEWQNPQPCIEDPEELSNQFSFANSVWLIIGSVMQQGSEIAPIALAPRMITSIWWFFTMIMVASYVGTLVAFLTVEKNVLPFTNVDELFRSNGIKYGAKDTGSTINFFKDAPEGTVYKRMYNKMIDKGWNAPGNDEGVQKAEEGNYAFFMESPSIEYYKERHCSLMQIGDTLDSKSYGIGIKKGSPYKKVMDDALLKLQENGELQKLKDLWYKERRGGGKCGKQTDETDTQLGMKHMTGVFVVLGVGCILGLVISILDMLWGVFQRSFKYKTTFKYELIEELKFAIKFSGDVKPVKRPAKTDESGEADGLAEDEGKDKLQALRSMSPMSIRSTSTRRTSHSHSSRHSPSDISVHFARRRRYS